MGGIIINRESKEYAILIISGFILLKSALNVFAPNAAFYETVRGYLEKQAQTVAVMGAQLAQNGIGEAVASVFGRAESGELYQAYSQGLEIRHNGG